ncbi:MAG: hypothetical protein AB7I37_19500 [Pirellulales bacterium]
MVANAKPEAAKIIDAATLPDLLTAACRKSAIMEVELANARDDIASLTRQLSAAESYAKDLTSRLAAAGDKNGLGSMRERLPLADVREFGEKLRDSLAALPALGSEPSANAQTKINWVLIGTRDTAAMISELLLAAADRLDGHSADSQMDKQSAA